MGEKTSARLHQERTVRLHYAQWLSLLPTVHADVLEPIRKKMGVAPAWQRSTNT